MKKNLLLIIFWLSVAKVFSQGYYVDNFDTVRQIPFRIDTPLAGNIWQIGPPQKIIFDSAYSAPNAIVTDTLNPYPINNRSSFTITIRDTMVMSWMIGSAYISFYHKFDTDSLHDGCFIELSQDGGLTWQNVVNSIYYLSAMSMYTYLDTLQDGTPAFSGSSNGWLYSEFAFIPCWSFNTIDSLMVRFTFQSDSINNSKEGWMIDDLWVSADVCEGVNEHQLNPEMLISPNPAGNELTVSSLQGAVKEIEIYSSLGEKVFSQLQTTNHKQQTIDVSQLPPGIYFITVTDQTENKVTRKVVKM